MDIPVVKRWPTLFVYWEEMIARPTALKAEIQRLREQHAAALNRIATAAVEGDTEGLVAALDEARDALNA